MNRVFIASIRCLHPTGERNGKQEVTESYPEKISLSVIWWISPVMNPKIFFWKEPAVWCLTGKNELPMPVFRRELTSSCWKISVKK